MASAFPLAHHYWAVLTLCPYELIVLGFLKVKIEGLPPALEEEMERVIQVTGKGLSVICEK